MYEGVSPDVTPTRFPRAKSGGFVRESFDRDYVERLRDGDFETEEHFTNYFGELLRIKLRARLRSPQLAEDLRQETFLRVLVALRRKQSLEHPERLGAFVNSVCNNILLECYRMQGKTEAAPVDDYDPPDQRVSAESTLVSEERKREVWKVLEQLPEHDRELLRMLFYEDVDKDEICRRFGVDRDYLRVLVHRAKGRFRKSLLEQREKAERRS